MPTGPWGTLPRGCRGLGRRAPGPLPVGSSTAEAKAMLVDWPRIRVIGDDVRRAIAPERDRVLWRSNDGGSTWNAVDN